MIHGVSLHKFGGDTPPITPPKKNGICATVYSGLKSLYDLFMRALKYLCPCLKNSGSTTLIKQPPPSLSTRTSIAPPSKMQPGQSSQSPPSPLIDPLPSSTKTKIESLETQLEHISARELKQKQLDLDRSTERKPDLKNNDGDKQRTYTGTLQAKLDEVQAKINELKVKRAEQKKLQEHLDNKINTKLNTLETKLKNYGGTSS